MKDGSSRWARAFGGCDVCEGVLHEGVFGEVPKRAVAPEESAESGVFLSQSDVRRRIPRLRRAQVRSPSMRAYEQHVRAQRKLQQIG